MSLQWIAQVRMKYQAKRRHKKGFVMPNPIDAIRIEKVYFVVAMSCRRWWSSLLNSVRLTQYIEYKALNDGRT